MTLHITGMIWARPTSGLEASAGPAWQADHIGAITRVQEEGGFDRLARPLRCPVVERIFAAAVLGAWLDAVMLFDKGAEPAGPASGPDRVQGS